VDSLQKFKIEANPCSRQTVIQAALEAPLSAPLPYPFCTRGTQRRWNSWHNAYVSLRSPLTQCSPVTSRFGTLRGGTAAATLPMQALSVQQLSFRSFDNELRSIRHSRYVGRYLPDLEEPRSLHENLKRNNQSSIPLRAPVLACATYRILANRRCDGVERTFLGSWAFIH
jgi:hypothetical protein